MRSVYLDYNGSTPLDPRVAEIMVPILMEGIGNASSIHRFGRQQSIAVDEAREHVGAMVGGRSANVVFTSGATESNNLALTGAVEGAPVGRSRILISAIEHASVRETARWLDERGMTNLGIIPVSWTGIEVKRTTAPKVTPSMRSALRDLGLAEVIVVHAGRESYPLGAHVRGVAAGRLEKDLGV